MAVSYGEAEDPDLVERDKEFYGAVREYLVLFLLFLILYTISHQLVHYFKRKRDKEDSFSVEEDGSYRFSLYLCSFTLAVSLAAIFLLPFSIFTCEVSLRYPDNYYMQWLNFSLLKLVWNMVFFCSNFCLLCMMPFVYFFLEAEGFSGWRSGIHSRVFETLVMLFLLLTMLSCAVWLISRWFFIGDGNDESYFLNVFPLLYSFVSLCGVLFTLLSLPMGIEYIIVWFGNQLVLPKADDEMDMLQMEEEDLMRRLEMSATSPVSPPRTPSHLVQRVKTSAIGSDHDSPSLAGTPLPLHRVGLPTNGLSPTLSRDELKRKLHQVRQQQLDVRNRFGSTSFYWTLFFSLCTLFVLFLTAIALLSSGKSFLQLLFYSDALAMGATEMFLGRLKSSQTILGSIGALLEMALVVFFALSSLIGVYTSGSFTAMRPRPGDTPLLLMIANCNLVLLLSSALPVLIRSLGISRFDLVGMFGNLHWLSNWYLVMAYHLIFFLTIVYLWTRRVTHSVVAKVGHFFNLLARKKHAVYFQEQSKLPRSPSHDSLLASAWTPQTSPISSLTTQSLPDLDLVPGLDLTPDLDLVSQANSSLFTGEEVNSPHKSDAVTSALDLHDAPVETALVSHLDSFPLLPLVSSSSKLLQRSDKILPRDESAGGALDSGSNKTDGGNGTGHVNGGS